MSTNCALAERFAHTLTEDDLDAFAELLDDEYINDNRYGQPGKDGSVAIFAGFLASASVGVLGQNSSERTANES